MNLDSSVSCCTGTTAVKLGWLSAAWWSSAPLLSYYQNLLADAGMTGPVCSTSWDRRATRNSGLAQEPCQSITNVMRLSHEDNCSMKVCMENSSSCQFLADIYQVLYYKKTLL